VAKDYIPNINEGTLSRGSSAWQSFRPSLKEGETL